VYSSQESCFGHQVVVLPILRSMQQSLGAHEMKRDREQK
jgi:hypothetical protein